MFRRRSERYHGQTTCYKKEGHEKNERYPRLPVCPGLPAIADMQDAKNSYAQCGNNQEEIERARTIWEAPRLPVPDDKEPQAVHETT